ncbi:DUF2147 domain-containing protein [Sphingomonas pituitosa]|uniref:DUF2147 domain-containing protein n=1 Tax=Sphingomonas pituitosa TaxID=99597 RepID=UPI0008306203|nr:DUF2147 domain-containing protein [Sphingomonas pituitosa]
MHKTYTATVAALASLLISTAALAAAPITGTWMTEGGKALVRIEPCGDAMCGRIVKVLRREPGKPTTDIANPDPAKRNNPIEGTFILTGFKDAGALWKGKIYNPDSGKTYAAKLTRNADGTLKVEGCVAFLCRGPIWTPAG